MTVATLLFTCLIFLLVGWKGNAYYVTALSVGAIVCIAASNGGTTSQDLKTGFLLGSTPKLQQYAILIGAFCSALIMGPLLLRLNNAATVYVPVAEVAPAGLHVDPGELHNQEKLKGPQAQRDANTYYSWHKTDEAGAPAGKYLVNAQGDAVWLVDLGHQRHAPEASRWHERAEVLMAPKAVLVSYIINGILDHKLPWALVILGVMITLTLQMSFVQALAFAVGVYLPLSSDDPDLRRRDHPLAGGPQAAPDPGLRRADQDGVRGGERQESGRAARLRLHRGRCHRRHRHRHRAGLDGEFRRGGDRLVRRAQPVLWRRQRRPALAGSVRGPLRVSLFRKGAGEAAGAEAVRGFRLNVAGVGDPGTTAKSFPRPGSATPCTSPGKACRPVPRLPKWVMQNPSGLRELTVRSVILGGVITLVFTAANVYLGLKVGLTFATSIPAAVISMALLRLVGNSNILENNIVQTIASAAGTLAAIIFVLPGLIMVGWWQGFPYWTTAAVCAIGGTLGVMFSVPLRRALVTGSDLPYPEGVAAAEVLKVGFGSAEGSVENAKGLRMIIVGSVVSAGYALLAAMRLAAGEVAHAFRVGSGATAGVDQPFARVDRRGPPGRPVGRPRDARGHADFVGRPGAGAPQRCTESVTTSPDS